MKRNALFLAASLVALLAGCTDSGRYQTLDGTMLGTTFHVIVRSDLPSERLYRGIMRIDAEAKASMSIFDPDSRLSRINDNRTDSLDTHLLRNMEVAAAVNRISGGAFDITVKPLTDAYGFAAEGRIEHPNVDSLMEFVGFDKFRIDGGRVVKSDPRVQFDLNSIAKGYTVDMVAAFLEECGSTDYIVEVGGEIRARGVNAEGNPWRVAVDTPFYGNSSRGEFRQTIVRVNDCAVATSGNYRRYYVGPDGTRITHTIDPHTGHSRESRLLSATVIAGDCTQADALATMFMVLGDGPAERLAESMRDSVQVYFVLAPAEGSEEYGSFSTLDGIHAAEMKPAE